MKNENLDLKKMKYCQEYIENLPEEKKSEITFDLDEESFKKLQKLAKVADVSEEGVVNFIIREVLFNDVAKKYADKHSAVIDSVDFAENIEYWLDTINNGEVRWKEKPLLVIDYDNINRSFVVLPEDSPIAKEATKNPE